MDCTNRGQVYCITTEGLFVRVVVMTYVAPGWGCLGLAEVEMLYIQAVNLLYYRILILSALCCADMHLNI